MSYDFLNFSLTQFQLFIIVSFRMSGMILVAPFFGNAAFPVVSKVGISIFLALLLFPLLNTQGVLIPQNLGAFVVIAASELGLGLILGLVAGLIFAGVQLGGQLISQQMGITIADVIDPVSNTSLSIVAQYQMLYVSLIFVLLGGPNYLVSTMFRSFVEVPIAGFVFHEEMVREVTGPMAGKMFTIAIKSGAPAMVALLVATIAMGFIARTVPEMNIFIIGFSVRLGMGLVILWMTVGMFTYLFQTFMADMFDDLARLIVLMH